MMSRRRGLERLLTGVICMVLMLMAFSVRGFAEGDTTAEAGGKAPEAVFVDKAKLLDEEDSARLLKEADSVAKKYDIDIVFYTNEDSGVSKSNLRSYSERLGLNKGYGAGPGRHFLILYINMKAKVFYINEHEKDANHIYTDTEIDRIIEDVQTAMRAKDYTGAVEDFILDADHYGGITVGTNKKKNDNYMLGEKKSFFDSTFNKVWVSLAAATIVVLILSARSKSRITTTARSYLHNKQPEIYESKDVYTHTTTTRSRISSSSSGGGGGGGSSGGGSSASHGGGGSF